MGMNGLLGEIEGSILCGSYTQKKMVTGVYEAKMARSE